MKIWNIFASLFLIMNAASVVEAQAALSEKGLTPIYIFNDQSHEFTFQYDWWLRAYFPEQKYLITSNLATLDEHNLKGYRILLVEMHASGVAFTDPEIALIERFVREGGGLFLIGNGYFWFQRHPDESYPLNRLSKRFGFEFTPVMATGQLRPLKDEITTGVTAFEQKKSAKGKAFIGTLKVLAKQVKPLISDEKAIPVFASRKYGAGKIVVAAGVNLLSPEHLGRPLRNKKLIQNIFTWLSQGTKPFRKATPDTSRWANKEGTRILPENRRTLGKVTYYYSEGLAGKAKFIHTIFPKIFTRLDSMTGVKPIFDFTVILLASTGGGYSGGNEIGIGCLAEESYVVRVIAHELTHSWVNPGPLPFYFNEAWASLIAIRIATQLGYTNQPLKERESFKKAFEKADPQANKLNLNNPPKAEAAIPAYTGKAMWIAEKLEQDYGNDFLKRFFITKRRVWQKTNQLTMAEFIQVLSTTVGKNLQPFFSQTGITF